jgi:hypothetical protein
MPFSQLMADFDPTRFRNFPTAEAVQGLASFCEDIALSFDGNPVVESTVTEGTDEPEEEQDEALEEEEEEEEAGDEFDSL